MLLRLLFLSALSPSAKILYSVIAQDLTGEPACASACLSSAITAAGCAPDDQGCQCGPAQSPIGIDAASCLAASCPATEFGAIKSIGLALCAQYSSDLTLTTASSSSSSRNGTGVETSPVTVTITNAPTVTLTNAPTVTLTNTPTVTLATASVSAIAAGIPTTASHSSLGSSAIVGVVIGVIAAVVGMGVLLRFAIFKPRGKSKSAGVASYKTPGWPELEGCEKSKPQELDGEHRISELGEDGESPVGWEISSREIYEMPRDGGG
jgi:hypothetical protein